MFVQGPRSEEDEEEIVKSCSGHFHGAEATAKAKECHTAITLSASPISLSYNLICIQSASYNVDISLSNVFHIIPAPH